MVSAKGENEVVPAPEIEPTQIVDVTGAGDVLAGSVAGYLARTVYKLRAKLYSGSQMHCDKFRASNADDIESVGAIHTLVRLQT